MNRAPLRVNQANHVARAHLALVNPNQANQIRANRIPASPNRVNRIRRAEASLTQANLAIAIPTAPATQRHPVAVIPATALRAVARVADQAVRIVNRRARKVKANRRVSQIRKIPAATVSLCRVTRNPATPVAADLLPRAIPVRAKAQANQATRRANLKANLKVIQTPKANHPVVSAQVTAKATAFHGQPVTQPVVLQATRRVIRLVVRQADQTVIHLHPPATHTIRQPVNRIARA